MKNSKEEIPVNPVISFRQVQLKKKSFLFSRLEGVDDLMNRNNRIQDLSAWDKTCLLGRDKQGKNSEEPGSENLGNDLIERVAKTNRPEPI